MERLDSDLQNQVTKLATALKEITKRERQQITERVHNDCARVRDDMSQTMNIQHYLNLLLAEMDPFLLIWVGDVLYMFAVQMGNSYCKKNKIKQKERKLMYKRKFLSVISWKTCNKNSIWLLMNKSNVSLKLNLIFYFSILFLL